MGNREYFRDVTRTGNREWGMGNGKWGIEKLEIVVIVITTEKLEWVHLLAHRLKYFSGFQLGGMTSVEGKSIFVSF